MPHPFDLVLFDLDGTLIETAPEIADAVNDTLRRFELPHVSQQQVNDWIGQGTRELLIQALAYTGGTSAAVVRSSPSFALIEAEFAHHYLQRCGTRSRLYPQVRETLHALQMRGIKLALLTNKESAYTQAVLDAHDLTRLFDKVICGDTLPTKKPHPAGVEACLTAFNVVAERALLVGDSRIDVLTARQAHIQVWVVPYGYNMGEPIENSGPDRVITDCSELLKQ
jgi:phosphoglycolate phosphatase